MKLAFETDIDHGIGCGTFNHSQGIICFHISDSWDELVKVQLPNLTRHGKYRVDLLTNTWSLFTEDGNTLLTQLRFKLGKDHEIILC